MPRAVWNGVVVAESDDTVVVEGNHYFPPESIAREYFQPSQTTSVCGCKGTASYYSLLVNGQENEDAAWFYESPKPESANIQNRVAFWKGVQIEDS